MSLKSDFLIFANCTLILFYLNGEKNNSASHGKVRLHYCSVGSEIFCNL